MVQRRASGEFIDAYVWLGRPQPKYKRRWCASKCVSRRKSPKQKTPVRIQQNNREQKWIFPWPTQNGTFFFANIWPHFCSRVRDFLVLFKMMSKCLVLTLMVSLSVCAPRPKADPDHLHYAYGRNYHYDPYAVHHAGYEHKRGYHHDIPGHHAYGTKKNSFIKGNSEAFYSDFLKIFPSFQNDLKCQNYWWSHI